MSVNVPKNWEEQSLGNLTYVRTGKKDVNQGNPKGKYPFFTCARKIHRIDTFEFDTEAILVAGNGFFNVKYYKGKFDAYQRTYVIDRSKIDTKYLFYFIMYSLPFITKDSRGSTIKFIRLKNLTEYKIQISPLPEQHRIVAKIEELFSRLDASVDALKQAQALLKRYRRSVLKAAVEGRLTAEWREQNLDELEPADKLLERIQKERKASLGKNYKELVPFDTTDLPELPYEWIWVRFSSLLRESLRNGKSAKESEDNRGIRTLTLTAVTAGDFSKKNTKIVKIDEDSVKNLWLEKGDILIERSNTIELVGTARLYSYASKYAIFPDLLIRARVVKEIPSKYIAYVLESDHVKSYFRKNARGTAGNMPKISQPIVENVAIPLPFYREQIKIIKDLEKVESNVFHLNKVIQNSMIDIRSLRQSILKRAFEGKLGTQDPNDEPASVLLERIKAEKTKPKKSKQMEMF